MSHPPGPGACHPSRETQNPKPEAGGGATPCLSFPSPEGAKGDKQRAEAAAPGMGKEALGLSAGVPHTAGMQQPP